MVFKGTPKQIRFVKYHLDETGKDLSSYGYTNRKQVENLTYLEIGRIIGLIKEEQETQRTLPCYDEPEQSEELVKTETLKQLYRQGMLNDTGKEKLLNVLTEI